jgi:hypothetical protein
VLKLFEFIHPTFCGGSLLLLARGKLHLLLPRRHLLLHHYRLLHHHRHTSKASHIEEVAIHHPVRFGGSGTLEVTAQGIVEILLITLTQRVENDAQASQKA